MKIFLNPLSFIFFVPLIILAVPLHSQAMRQPPQQKEETKERYQDTKQSFPQKDDIPEQSKIQIQETEDPFVSDEDIKERSQQWAQGAKGAELLDESVSTDTAFGTSTAALSLPPGTSTVILSNEKIDSKPTVSSSELQLLIVVVLPIVIISSLFIMFYVRRKSVAPSKTPFKSDGFGDIAVNDAAIGSSDYDQLGTSVLAKGLSLFLCNKKTIPPITLAVTGEWGSGKSSVMGMLMGYLKDARFRPIWFNAWHHYKEEHMFGALLETIRQETVPPVWSPSGLSFRVRLLARRAWRHPLITILLLSFASFLILFYFLADLSPSKIEDELVAIKNNPAYIASILIPFIGVLTVLTKGLTAFGFNPGLLFRKISHSLKSTGVNADPGLRYRINQYLDDITWALSNRTLVIFIDDLDRCPPDQVLRALECANFLSSNPRRSYIVLGMALDKVLPSISGEFNYIVEEALMENKDESVFQRGCRLKEERLAYAKNYLEKMINMEIHIPTTPAEKIERLADSKVENDKLAESNQDKSNRIIRIIDQRVFPLLLLAFMLFGIITGGDYAANLYRNSKLDGIQQNKENSDASSKPISHEDPLSIAKEADITKTHEKPTIPKGLWRSYWWICLEILGSVFGAVVFAYYFISKKTEINDDSDFIEALKLWTQIIIMNNKTPRHFKRAVNQLRLLAMRMQIEEGYNNLDSSQNNQIVRFIVLKAIRDLGVDLEQFLEIVTEDSIANLSSNKDGIDRCIKKLITIIRSKFDVNRLFVLKDDSNIEAFAKVVIDHQNKFPGQWPTSNDVDRYKLLMTGIALR